MALFVYNLFTSCFLSELEAVVRSCEAKYLRKRGWLKKVKMVLSEDDVHRDLTRIHEQIQMSYSKWMVRFVLQNDSLGLKLVLQGRD